MKFTFYLGIKFEPGPFETLKYLFQLPFGLFVRDFTWGLGQ